MDLMNEILNRPFKDLLGAAKGRYIETTIKRSSHIVCPLGESLDVVFDSNVVENALYRHRRRYHDRDKNVQFLIQYLKDDDLFIIKLGRFHRAFTKTNHSETPKCPAKILD